MQNNRLSRAVDKVPVFKRKFFASEEPITRIGYDSIGGKALGLAFIHDFLKDQLDRKLFSGVEITIPRFTVLSTSLFDSFMKHNKLQDIAYSDAPDDRIAHAFQNADLPVEFLGDLRALISDTKTPLAIRSSSMLEDAIYEPFAGVYGTKMIPNNQPSIDQRYSFLTEAIKFVYASTFFRDAKSYIRATNKKTEDEKMAVIIQEVVGLRHDQRYYPHISGVARSYNFYPTGHAKPEDGVVDLALGLGKTIVDGGVAWTFSPAYPKSVPPSNSIGDLLKDSQTKFWAINMGKPPEHDPVKETEYLLHCGLKEAEFDGTLEHIASTYSVERDRLVIGTGPKGPRLLNFAPILEMNKIPLVELVKTLLKICEEAVGTPVETEFAINLDNRRALPARFGFLQVRPMVVSDERVELNTSDLEGDNVLLASEKIMGNGTRDDLVDIVYVKPDPFEARYTQQIETELEKINLALANENRHYLLIGFGRWGSSDPWLGIGVNWGQIGNARVIVEATLPDMNVELSQGSHFFHNLSSFQVTYFCVHHDRKFKIDWDWLAGQNAFQETDFVRHIRLKQPILVKVDGRGGRGVIYHAQ
jgi:hypothetical protein